MLLFHISSSNRFFISGMETPLAAEVPAITTVRKINESEYDEFKFEQEWK